MEGIGLQLYSIKELTEKDLIGALKEVARIGYDGVEFAGFFDTPAKELKKALNDLNLKPCGSHTGIDLLQNKLEDVIQYNLEIGNSYIVCPGLPPHMRDSADAYRRLADLFNQIGQQCKRHGIQFAYHNHDFEFQKFNGEYGLDILLSNTDPDLVHMELDTFWVEYCGLKSVDFMRKYRQQCSSLIHIKDLKSMDEKISTEIGKGIMDFVEIVELGKELGIKWYIVEQEEFEIPQLESIQISLEYLRSIL
ncbi:MAG: sugar phosphate isomerase/epimerase [Clostridiales bacterium]|jgi:sugar phosphate isomerase/epimerase|nr:sugar phosphate isomerase/epimerase [Clostridiales bacterium]